MAEPIFLLQQVLFITSTYSSDDLDLVLFMRIIKNTLQ